MATCASYIKGGHNKQRSPGICRLRVIKLKCPSPPRQLMITQNLAEAAPPGTPLLQAAESTGPLFKYLTREKSAHVTEDQVGNISEFIRKPQGEERNVCRGRQHLEKCTVTVWCSVLGCISHQNNLLTALPRTPNSTRVFLCLKGPRDVTLLI